MLNGRSCKAEAAIIRTKAWRKLAGVSSVIAKRLRVTLSYPTVERILCDSNASWSGFQCSAECLLSHQRCSKRPGSGTEIKTMATCWRAKMFRPRSLVVRYPRQPYCGAGIAWGRPGLELVPEFRLRTTSCLRSLNPVPSHSRQRFDQ